MSDYIQSRPPESRLRRIIKYSMCSALAATALFADYRLTHHSIDADTSSHDVPATSTISLPLGTKGTALVFSARGSDVERSIQFASYQEVESQKNAKVTFDKLHCEDRELHGGMFVTAGPNTAIWTTDMVLPENTLSESWCVGGELPAHAGKLMIAGSAYPYTLGK
jgi:hypothetical protein